MFFLLVQRFFRTGAIVNRLLLAMGVGVLLLLGTGCRPSASPRDTERSDGPHVRLTDETGTAVEVAGIDAKELAELQARKLKTDEWTTVFAVYVERDNKVATDQIPVLGDYKIAEGLIHFEPRYPLMRGVRYQAIYHRADLNSVVAHLFIAKPQLPPTVVEQVFPTRDALPENQLKFYLHFSAPMSRGEAYEHIQLLGDDGKPVAKPFLVLDQELWDADGKRFTLFFDPGRIKRGLKPREELGPALMEGKRYTLVIDRGWDDANGEPLKETFRKSFRVLAPDDVPPDAKAWKLDAPAANGAKPLTVTFPKSMDSALAARLVWVTDGDGHKVAGTVALSQEETRWQFTPAQTWKAGKYDLVADTRLEDLAGNSLGRPFEVAASKKVQPETQAETVKLPFESR